mmetsp:Transcript_13111/g.30975  ORF Transcript_13111/g.30975 Transcript_13111/m.30975 type:complete len:224 (+) Transcript_13111:1216-1887(+)
MHTVPRRILLRRSSSRAVPPVPRQSAHSRLGRDLCGRVQRVSCGVVWPQRERAVRTVCSRHLHKRRWSVGVHELSPQPVHLWHGRIVVCDRLCSGRILGQWARSVHSVQRGQLRLGTPQHGLHHLPRWGHNEQPRCNERGCLRHVCSGSLRHPVRRLCQMSCEHLRALRRGVVVHRVSVRDGDGGRWRHRAVCLSRRLSGGHVGHRRLVPMHTVCRCNLHLRG